MAPTSEMSPEAVADPSRAERTVDTWAEWRFWIVAGVWAVVIVGALLSVQTAGMTLGIGVGRALGATTTPDDGAGVWSWWIGIVVGVGIAAIGAIIMRRRVALALALLILVTAGFFVNGISGSVRLTQAPVEHVVEGLPRCACYSGSVCDCPGG